jgi:hypothetical protein
LDKKLSIFCDSLLKRFHFIKPVDEGEGSEI